MRHIKSLTLVLALWCSITAAWASPQNALVFEVVAQQMIFDKTTVESAKLQPNHSVPEQYQLQLKLTPAANAQLQQIWQHSVGKRVNLVFNNKVISTATLQGGKQADTLIILGLNKTESEQFIQSLK